MVDVLLHFDRLLTKIGWSPILTPTITHSSLPIQFSSRWTTDVALPSTDFALLIVLLLLLVVYFWDGFDFFCLSDDVILQFGPVLRPLQLALILTLLDGILGCKSLYNNLTIVPIFARFHYCADWSSSTTHRNPSSSEWSIYAHAQSTSILIVPSPLHVSSPHPHVTFGCVAAKHCGLATARIFPFLAALAWNLRPLQRVHLARPISLAFIDPLVSFWVLFLITPYPSTISHPISNILHSKPMSSTT